MVDWARDIAKHYIGFSVVLLDYLNFVRRTGLTLILGRDLKPTAKARRARRTDAKEVLLCFFFAALLGDLCAFAVLPVQSQEYALDPAHLYEDRGCVAPRLLLSHLSFTVASAIAASMAPTSQKRTTTCVSLHPFSWK